MNKIVGFFESRLLVFKASVFLFAGCSLIDPPPPVAYSQLDYVPHIESVVVIGDSIAAGLFADTQMGESLSLQKTEELFAVLSALPDEPQTFKPAIDFLNVEGIHELHRPMAALITDVFNLALASGSLSFEGAFKNLSQPDYEAYGGRQSYSHARKIEAVTGKSVGVQNRSLLGARAIGSFGRDEIAKLEESYTDGAQVADYVVFSLGSNDLIADLATPEERSTFKAQIDSGELTVRQVRELVFRRELKARLDHLARIHPRSTTVLVPGIADVRKYKEFVDLGNLQEDAGTLGFSISKDNLESVTGRAFSGDRPFYCGYLHFWYSMSDVVPRSPKPEYLFSAADINDLIQDTIETVNQETKSRIVFGESVSQTPITAEMYGSDCFHPGREGHRALAEATWKDVTRHWKDIKDNETPGESCHNCYRPAPR